MTSKYALVIANTEYQDPNFAKLTAPGRDAEEFAQVLRDLAGFEVKVLLNEGESKTSRAIGHFFKDRKHDDLLLLYFSGHGVRNEQGLLFLAATDTELKILEASSVPAEFITKSMNASRSQRQILILDCCNSGAFDYGSKSVGQSMGIATAFEGNGFGRVVLTATDATQFAWEGDKIIGNTQKSVFTHFLIEGLRGEADRDGNGRITVDELYDYAYEKVVRVTPKQTPSHWAYRERGEIILVENLMHRHVKLVPLPSGLLDILSHPNPKVRKEGIEKLIALLDGGNLGLMRSAQEKLQDMADTDDSYQLRELAGRELKKRGLTGPISAVPVGQKKPQPFFWFDAKIAMGITIAFLVLFLGAWGIYKLLNDVPPATPSPVQSVVPTGVVATEPLQTPASPPPEHPPSSVPPIEDDFSTGKDGMPLILVPAGEFTMGSAGNDADERPVHTVYLDAFLIDRTEVTNAMYAGCVKSKRCDPPRAITSITQNAANDSFYYGNPDFDDYPVIFVSWIDAKAYCRWVGRRLPTEAEWEKAASWDDEQKTKRSYPWGNTIDCSYANFYGKGNSLCVGDTTPVGSYPEGASYYGVLDMAGNVWEWIADRYAPEYYGMSEFRNPIGPASGDTIVRRGGSFLTGRAVGIRSSDRDNLPPDNTSHNLGFRCAVDAP